MDFIVPTLLLGMAIVMVVMQIYEIVQIDGAKKALPEKHEPENRMSDSKRNTMYNLENLKLAKKRR